MCRLLQGDVGSGKTVVAAAALLAAAANGYQGALLAPTEILAEQHYRGLSALLAPFGLKVVLLTGSQKAKERTAARTALANGEAAVAIGTHALIQEGVEFKRLGLAVVDEQHRFGVEQRDALRQKGHQSAHARDDRDADPAHAGADALRRPGCLGARRDAPAGRLPIITRWRAGASGRRRTSWCARRSRRDARRTSSARWSRSRRRWRRSRRSRSSSGSRRDVFPDLRLGLVHGQLRPAEKERVMRAFRDGELDVLVATAVVEVGVDVPNATVMLIEDAERFGLSQLHQFRGRVGRGEHCNPIAICSAKSSSVVASERLGMLERTTDGFKLAEEDLRLRGPGDFFGTRQSGLPELKVATMADTQLLVEARVEAEELWKRDPYLRALEHAALRERVFLFWRNFAGH